MGNKKVLLIEDEVKLARFIELDLKYESYEVEVCYDGRVGLETFYNGQYDLILLDLMLPGLNGIEICRRIRKTSDVPIIMLTAKDEVMDKVAGLDSGADDYLTKPFAIEELLARMRVVMKRKSSEQSKKNTYEVSDLIIDPEKRLVKVKNKEVELTKKEYELLFYMVQNKNIVLTREQILNEVWGYNYIGETNVVDVYVRYLRSKIDEPFGAKYIHTIRGVGYYVKDDKQEND
ncbi:MAG: response regulator transcription factor [Lachnospiraceae bacterium]|nr:response regulator transcription factor [Lachnospiraceae bacterium]